MKLVFASFLVFCLGAASITKQEIVGKWKQITEDDKGIEVLFEESNIYRVDFNSDGVYDLSGKYALMEGKISVTDSEGDCEGKTGVYTLAFEEGKMLLTQISEECEGRTVYEGEIIQFSRKE